MNERNGWMVRLKRILPFTQIKNQGAEWLTEAMKENSVLQDASFNLENSKIGRDLQDQIFQLVLQNRIRKQKNDLAFICAFTKLRIGLIKLPFDKMMMSFVFYPLMGVSPDEVRNSMNLKRKGTFET
jgi:hypothetical protein